LTLPLAVATLPHVRRLAAALVIACSACAHLPYPDTPAEQARVSEARYYQTMGGIFVGTCVATGFGGVLTTLAVADANVDVTPVLAATGVGVAVSCIVGGVLIKTGNDVVRGWSYDAPEDEGAAAGPMVPGTI